MEIHVSNVSKIIKYTKVLDAITLNFVSGKIYGLQGINGSGKTMLMRVISGLVHPTEGTVFIDGEILGKDISFPKDMGLLIENPAFLGNYSAFDNIKVLCSIRNKVENTVIQQSIEKVGLDPQSHLPYKKFSLGMKQRLGICAAFVESPQLLLLDEPTNALDLDGIKMVREILFEMKQQGAITIIASHDADLLDEFSDQIISLESGKISSVREANK